jgi:hypothetical protein
MPDENGYHTEDDVLDAFRRLKHAIKNDPTATALLEESINAMLNYWAAPDSGIDPGMFETLQEVIDWKLSPAIKRFHKTGRSAT